MKRLLRTILLCIGSTVVACLQQPDVVAQAAFGRARWPEVQAEAPVLLDYRAGATYAYGQSVQFDLIAEVDQEVESATLLFWAPELPYTFTEIVQVTPGRSIALSHELSLHVLQLAPFTTVTYWWQLVTPTGEVRVPEQTFYYEDDQFAWIALERPGMIVLTPPPDLGMGQIAAEILEATVDNLAPLLGRPQPGPVRLYVYPGTADIQAAFRLTGREWVQASTIARSDIMLVTAINERTARADLLRSIPAELVKLLLYQEVGSLFHRVPFWLQSGLVTRARGEPDLAAEQALRTALADSETLPVSNLCRLTEASGDDRYLVQAESAALLQFLIERRDKEALSKLLALYTSGQACQAGLKLVLGETPDRPFQAWLRRRHRIDTVLPPSTTDSLVNNSIWIVLLIIGAAISSLLLVKVRWE